VKNHDAEVDALYERQKKLIETTAGKEARSPLRK
jgi:hypothetical protein